MWMLCMSRELASGFIYIRDIGIYATLHVLCAYYLGAYILYHLS